MAAGFDGYVSKPMELNALLDEIRNGFGSRTNGFPRLIFNAVSCIDTESSDI